MSVASSDQSSPSLFPVVCDLSDVEYSTSVHRESSGSFSSSSFSGVAMDSNNPLCPCPNATYGPPSLDFSFADLCDGTLQDLIAATTTTTTQTAPTPADIYNLQTSLVSPSTQEEEEEDSEDEFEDEMEQRRDAPLYFFNSEMRDTDHGRTKTVPYDDSKEKAQQGVRETTIDFVEAKRQKSTVNEIPETTEQQSQYIVYSGEEQEQEEVCDELQELVESEIKARTKVPPVPPPRVPPVSPPQTRLSLSGKEKSWRSTASSFFRKNLKQFCFPNRESAGSNEIDSVSSSAKQSSTFNQVYRLTQKIVQGSKSVLWECENRDGQGFLAKVFTWDTINEVEKIQYEVDIWRLIQSSGLNDSCLMDVVDIFDQEEQNFAFVVLEKCDLIKEQTLQSLVLTEGCLPESFVRTTIHDILRALRGLHGLGIACNQLLPSAVLVGSLSSTNVGALLVDFGQCTLHQESLDYNCSRKVISDSVLRSAYLAPELLRPSSCLYAGCYHNRDESEDLSDTYCSVCGNLWGASDIWSVGVLAHYCLFGHVPPFLEQHNHPEHLPDEERCHREVYQHRGHHSDGALHLGGHGVVKSLFSSNSEKGWPCQHPDSNPVSRKARQFISTCLHQDPSVRMTLSEALLHPFIGSSQHELGPPIDSRALRESSPSEPRRNSGRKLMKIAKPWARRLGWYRNRKSSDT